MTNHNDVRIDGPGSARRIIEAEMPLTAISAHSTREKSRFDMDILARFIIGLRVAR